MRVDNSNVSTEYTTYSNFPLNTHVSDIAWSKNDPGKLALSFSTGSIISLNVTEFVNKQVSVTQEWSSGKVSTCINRVAWHPIDKSIIAAASQDGLVKMFDFRFSNNPCQVTGYGQRSSIALRDVAFDPFHCDVFAEVSDSGNLKLWDRRYLERPFMSKIAAHNQAILTVAWHPSTEYLLATGSRDKNIKIWDYNVCSIDASPAQYSVTASSANSRPASRGVS